MSNFDYQVAFRDKATFELEEAYDWYNEQREGLGEEFIQAVNAKLNLIAKNPLHYKKSYKSFHEALVDRFPFIIVYTLVKKDNLLLVAAIFHTSRSPKFKFKR